MNESTAKTSPGEKFFIALMSIFVAYCVFMTATVKAHGTSKTVPEAESDSAETFLLIHDALDAVFGNVASMVPAAQSNSKPGPDFLQNVNDGLLDELKVDPHNATTLTKLVIVRIEKHLPAQKYFDQLTKIDSQQAADDVFALETAYGFRAPKAVDSKTSHEASAAHQADSAAASLRALPKGWCERHARYVWQMRTGKKKEAEKTLQSIDDESVRFLLKMGAMIFSGALVAVVGVITLLAQLFVLARRVTPPQDMPLLVAPVDYGLLTVYKVFLYWILATLAVGTVLELVQPKDASPEIMALYTLLTYVLSYSPGVYFIYHFALKPYGVKFREGIKLKMRAGKLGPVRMVLAGFLSWSAAVPIVLIAYGIAQRFLHSHGSDNIIKDKILEAARTGDPIVIGSFFVMAGVLAPIIEESLFRGFLYTYLRRRVPVFPAMLITALLFAGVHLDPGGFLPLFCLGAVFAFTVEKTKSIVPSIIAHSLWNSVSFAFSLLLAG